MRILPRHGRRDVVARRRAVPDLPALVRGLRRRRDRRPARRSWRASTTSSGSASTGIWLNPTMPSPNDDWGYDVADYTRRAPRPRHARGPRRARRRRRRARHPRAARPRPEPHVGPPRVVRRRARAAATPSTATSTSGPTRRADGGPPNNWVSNFGGSAWTLDEPTRPVLPAQLPADPARPQLVERRRPRRVRRRSCGSGSTRGIAGFRIDVCHAIVKDRELRDDPAVTPDDHPEVQQRAVAQVFSMNRPEVHDVLRRWRAVADADDPRPRPRRRDLRARPRLS